jgi:hypothetical protein
MKETIGLLAMVFVYTIAFFGLGMFLQMKADQMQLKKFTDAAWREGCKTCAQFEENKCKRDELQGILGVSQIP